ncbi:uncharacterized protein LOC112524442 isoform X2 [Cynara cardunculus var. scolymus]|uniref:uncharacterized protein LOC112524442 isoform X2 n=1 Tax=Cynara cardunculus var. scolymus TaxID=59895 RepID=UPI000D630D31|nr:uncharacterized protein LOC112524442 isoform X2 [Cynara cardunculus var. scolymus]
MPIVKGFRRFQSNIVFSRTVVTEISNLVPGSNVQQSGRSSVAPFTSKRPIKKKVTSADRKAMLESFVSKYRAMNMGKFPPPTSAQKEVGGSYYLIKKMLQEMEYNFKISSLEKGIGKENKKQTKGEDTVSSEIAIEPSGSQEVSTSQITTDQQLYKDAWPESVGNFDTNFKSKEVLQPSTSSANTGNSTTRDDTNYIAMEGHDRRGPCHEKPENNVKDDSPLENFGFEGSESKVEQQHDGMRNIMRKRRARCAPSAHGYGVSLLLFGLIFGEGN